MEKQKVGVKMTLPYAEAIAYMEDLLKSLKAGTVVVQSGDAFVTLTPGDTVGIEVEAKVKRGKQKFGFELTWSEQETGTLVISDTEPVKAAAVATTGTTALAKATPAEVPATTTVKAADKKNPAPKKKATAKKTARKSGAKKSATKATPKKAAATPTGKSPK